MLRFLRLDERYLVRVLVLGFALVMVLLGVAALIAIYQSRRIRDGVAELARDQVLVARLVNDVQSEQRAVSQVLQRLTREGVPLADPAALLRQLDESDAALARVSADVKNAAGNELWSDLEASVHAFSAEAHRVLSGAVATEERSISSLFVHHDRVVTLVDQLVQASMQRLSVAEGEIMRQTRDFESDAPFMLVLAINFAAMCAFLSIRFARRSLERMRWQSDELIRVSWHLLRSQEDAARRFSHELHDELGQSLAAVRANLTHGSGRELSQLRQDCLHLLDESIANVRELSQLLRPVILDDFGLDAGLRWLAEGFAERTRLRVDYSSRCDVRFADEIETHLFRIAQEALTNVARHAEATSVRIELVCDGGTVRLSIEDDGKGLPQEGERKPLSPSLGMVGMRARARQCEGELAVVGVAPHGLRIEAVVPLRPRPTSRVTA